MLKGDKKFVETHKTFGNFSVKKDIAYIDDGNKYHLLDVMSPVLNHDNGITLFYIHGGAYIYGEKELNKIFTSWYVDQGFTVISINYRLINNNENVDFKEQINDIFSALNFIVENKHSLGIDLDNFCIMGDSAGGHMSLITDIIFHSSEVQNYYGFTKLPKLKIKCVALNSTMYDYPSLLPLARKFLTKKDTKKLFSKYCFDDHYMEDNSPSKYIQGGVKLDPLFASTSYHDMFMDQSLKLKHDAEKYNLDLEFLLETSPNKKIGHVYNHFVFDNEGLKCNNAMVKFFKKNCNIE